jgi:hypothetical protein
MLGTLIRGRVTVGGSAGAAARVALDIATRYALERRQFSAPGDEDEVLIMDYLVHQRRTSSLPSATSCRRRMTPTPKSSASWSPVRRA